MDGAERRSTGTDRWWEPTAENLALAVLALCGALLFGAVVLEQVFGKAPCPLCLMQRIWFFAAGAFAFTGLMHDPRWGIYPLLSLVSSLIGGGFAIRQLYLQSLPPDQVPACGPDVDYLLRSFPFSDVLRAMTHGTGDCAQVTFRFILTLPGWSLLGFAAVAALAATQLLLGNRR